MDMNRVKVSCHIITYNQKDYIAQCIEGVLMQQTDFSIELVIGDDNSTDGTAEIVAQYARQYPDLIKTNLREVRGTGIPGKDNFLTTMEMCTGEYISLCDGDDYWTDPLKLQKQIDFLEANPDYVLSFHKVTILKPDGEFVEDFITKVPEEYQGHETLARLGNYIHTPSVVFKNIVPAYSFEFYESPIGDYFLYMMLAEHGKLHYIKESMAVYRYGIGIYTSSTKLKQAHDHLKLFICLLSYSKKENIKKILFERYLQAVSHLENCISNQYKEKFKFYYKYSKVKDYLNANYKHPVKIITMLFRKLSRNPNDKLNK